MVRSYNLCSQVFAASLAQKVHRKQRRALSSNVHGKEYADSFSLRIAQCGSGDSCVKTEPKTKVFSGKGIAMMHECKRLLNHSTAAEGLLLACTSTQRTKVGCKNMEAFLIDDTCAWTPNIFHNLDYAIHAMQPRLCNQCCAI